MCLQVVAALMAFGTFIVVFIAFAERFIIVRLNICILSDCFSGYGLKKTCYRLNQVNRSSQLALHSLISERIQIQSQPLYLAMPSYLSYKNQISSRFNSYNSEKSNKILFFIDYIRSRLFIPIELGLIYNQNLSNPNNFRTINMEEDNSAQVGKLINNIKKDVLDLGDTNEMVIFQQDKNNEK